MDGIVISLGRGAVLNILYSDSSSIFTGSHLFQRVASFLQEKHHGDCESNCR